jgi:hypothetical protein
MEDATESLSSESGAKLYEQFLRVREEEIIREIRRVCGITEAGPPQASALVPEEVAADIADAPDDSAEEVQENPDDATAPSIMGAATDPPAVTLSPGLPRPAGVEWLTELNPAESFVHRWPSSGGHFDESYPIALQGRIRIDGAEREVVVGEGQRHNRGRLTVFLDRYPVAEFMETADGTGWASLIKPDGRKTVASSNQLPAIYRKSRVISYPEATGVSGVGHPSGMALVIDRDDIKSAVHHAAARQLAKLGRL